MGNVLTIDNFAGSQSDYAVAWSFVDYLIGLQGMDAFMASLSEWATRSEELIAEHEPGWRESLGLPPTHD